jgi:hypothetical protein
MICAKSGKNEPVGSGEEVEQTGKRKAMRRAHLSFQLS